MRRTWIGAAVAVALTTVSGTALAVAQEGPKDKEAPANHRTVSEKPQHGGQGQVERIGQPAKVQPQVGAPPNRTEERTAVEKGTQAEKRKGEAEKGAQTEGRRNGQAEEGAQAEERGNHIEKGTKPAEAREMQNRQGEAKTGQGEMQNRVDEAATGQSQKGAAPHNVQAMGAAHLSQDHAARIAQTLLATSSGSHHDNVDINVGVDLPGDIDVRPLPPNVVELVPEYRDYDYVVVNDEIAIVQPSTRRVVEVISEGGGAQAMNGTRLNPCGP